MRCQPQPQITLEPLPAGWHGTRRTLAVMRRLVYQAAANLRLRQVALQIVADVPGHDFEGEVHALFYFVRDRITYRKDPKGVELVKAPLRTLASGVGDCDDKGTLLAALLACLGHDARFVVSSRAGAQTNYQTGARTVRWDHVYVVVRLGGEWVPLDPTNERAEPGWQCPARARAVIR